MTAIRKSDIVKLFILAIFRQTRRAKALPQVMEALRATIWVGFTQLPWSKARIYPARTASENPIEGLLHVVTVG